MHYKRTKFSKVMIVTPTYSMQSISKYDRDRLSRRNIPDQMSKNFSNLNEDVLDWKTLPTVIETYFTDIIYTYSSLAGKVIDNILQL